jgi:prevent-host-death family protein
MMKIPNIIPITDLRHDDLAVLKRAYASQEPIVITKRGRADAVIVSVKTYQKTQTDMEILCLLACGEKGIEFGKGFSPADVLAEADVLLNLLHGSRDWWNYTIPPKKTWQ